MVVNKSNSSAYAGYSMPSGAKEILGVNFNQDGLCFGVGLETGLRIYASDPLKEIMRKGTSAVEIVV